MKKVSKYKNYLIACLLPAIICIIFLYFKGSLSSVENIFTSDLRCQHIVFLNYFKNVILGNASIFYSFSAGFGNPMLASMIFYCTSPINIILFLIKDIQVAMLTIYIVRIALSGLTMYILLKSRSKEERFITVVFSTCYALCSFVITYFYCFFWFDCLYLAPLVVLGIDKMFEKEKISFLYIIALALTIICNIQMGYGLCIFSVIYFFYSFNIRYEIKKDFAKFKKIALIFTIASLLAGAISSGTLLGFMSSYSDIASTRTISFTTAAPVSNLGYILKNLFSVGHYTLKYDNSFEPLIYCGLIVTFFSILFFFNKNIESKKKFHSLIVILVFFISFCINVLNLFWHLTPPVLFNFRYSEYLALFMVLMAYESYIKTDKLREKDITVLVISALMGLFVILGYNNDTYVVVTFIFLILVFTAIILTKNKNSKFEILLIIIVLAEAGISSYVSFYRSNDLYYARDTSYASFKEIALKNEIPDDYRVMYNYSYTDSFNDNLLLNNTSAGRYFSSVIYGKIIKFFNNTNSLIGITNYTLSAYDNPLLVSLLGHKYFYLLDDFNSGIYKKLDTYEVTSYDYMKGYDTTHKVYFYENPYALSLGYIIENDVKHEEDMNLVDYENAIIKGFSGIDKDVLIKLDVSLVSGAEHCYNSDQYPYCMVYYITNNTNNNIVYAYTPFSVFSLESNTSGYLDVNKPIAFRSIDKNITLSIEHIEPLNPDDFIAITYNKNNLIEALEKLQTNSLTNVNITNNVLTADIDAKKDGKLFLSIPYDENFTIYVDGKKTEYYSLLDNTFLGLDITNGKHTIKLEYINSNWKLYILSSAISLVLAIVITYFVNKKLVKSSPINLVQNTDKKVKIENEEIKKDNYQNKQKSKKKKKKGKK